MVNDLDVCRRCPIRIDAVQSISQHLLGVWQQCLLGEVRRESRKRTCQTLHDTGSSAPLSRFTVSGQIQAVHAPRSASAKPIAGQNRTRITGLAVQAPIRHLGAPSVHPTFIHLFQDLTGAFKFTRLLRQADRDRACSHGLHNSLNASLDPFTQ